MPKRKRKRKEDGSKDDVKFKGVTKSGRGFLAQIFVDYKRQYLGTFDTRMEAARAYDRAALQAGRSICKLNFQDKVPHFYTPKKRKLRCNNTLGYRGLVKKRNKFVAQMNIDGKCMFLGSFLTRKEAAIAYDRAAIKAKRPMSSLNFPDITIPKRKTTRRVRRKTSFHGVSKVGDKFRASFSLDGLMKNCGIFTRARDAAVAYDEAIVELSGRSIDELELNFPDGMSEEYEEEEYEE